ncbi:thiosulfate sulfurtransferase [Sphingobium sufflavum]|uniref:rhodanese-like domain-containing protein n=1 Tax=Sphingobium sufflavum TaxID=1129547 RepID=UPI001F384373|nr:rhodanese-like domain-containing protein [Sphingobium sufflavum]MCE7796144.1 thiosulfate sulfurtransferase [Sphingobium sufflavum]
MTIRTIHRATLQTWLTTGTPGQSAEFALLDLRDEQDFAKGQPLFATNLPLRRLEADVARFVPRRSVRTVLVDDGNGDAAKGAAILDALGYDDVAILSGGVPGWLSDSPNGLPTFDIAGNIFTVAVADQRGTPALTVAALKAAQDAGEDILVLDTRTPEEFARSHIPGSRSLPGGELLQRYLDYVPSAQTHVVVTCAWLARAIIGAQTLISARVPNRVSYLVEGTQAWSRAGYALETGISDSFDGYSEAAAAFGAAHARNLADEAGVQWIDAAAVGQWQGEADRTTYLLDVRLPAPFEAGHLAGSISAPGGQLLAVSHRTVAVRGARIVLIDDSEGDVRAITTAYWLKQRGWDARVFDGTIQDRLPGADARERIAQPA